MRFFRLVRASIFRARFSLSAVSSSTELDAVFTSTPRRLRRSMTSWLVRFRSLARWKTLTLTIRLPSLTRPLAGGRALRLRPGRRRRLRARRLFGRCLLGRPLLGRLLLGRLLLRRLFLRRLFLRGLFLGQPTALFLRRLLGR